MRFKAGNHLRSCVEGECCRIEGLDGTGVEVEVASAQLGIATTLADGLTGLSTFEVAQGVLFGQDQLSIINLILSTALAEAIGVRGSRMCDESSHYTTPSPDSSGVILWGVQPSVRHRPTSGIQ